MSDHCALSCQLKLTRDIGCLRLRGEQCRRFQNHFVGFSPLMYRAPGHCFRGSVVIPPIDMPFGPRTSMHRESRTMPLGHAGAAFEWAAESAIAPNIQRDPGFTG